MGLEITFPCDREGVLALLPHRDPFVWVSRIVSCEPGKFIVAELDVDPELPLFAGPFPRAPRSSRRHLDGSACPGCLLLSALGRWPSRAHWLSCRYR